MILGDKFEKMATLITKNAFDKNTIFIDVRSKAEVDQPPTLPCSSVNIPLESLKDYIIQLPPNKDAPIVVFCAHGIRSETAKIQLQSLGFTNVINGGGIEEVISVIKGEGGKGYNDKNEEAVQSRAPQNKGKLNLICELVGHTDAVWCASWSPNGKYIASCGSDLVINIWGQGRMGGGGRVDRSNSWVLLATLDEGQQRTIRNLSWSPCGHFIASVSFDGTCAIWEHSKEDQERQGMEMQWELIVQLEGHENEVKSVCWNHEGTLLATCGRDKSIWIWEAVDMQEAEFECLSVLQEHTQDVKCVKFHPEGGIGVNQENKMLVSASYDDTLKVWGEDGDDWVCCQTLIGHSSSVWCLAFGPSSTSNKVDDTILSVSDDNSMIVWTKDKDEKGNSNLGGWSFTHKISNAHTRALYSVDWDRKQHYSIATGGADNALRIFSTEYSSNGKMETPPVLDVEVKEAHDGDVNSVAWSPTNPTLLVSAGDDSVIRLWAYTV